MQLVFPIRPSTQPFLLIWRRPQQLGNVRVGVRIVPQRRGSGSQLAQVVDLLWPETMDVPVGVNTVHRHLGNGFRHVRVAQGRTHAVAQIGVRMSQRSRSHP